MSHEGQPLCPQAWIGRGRHLVRRLPAVFVSEPDEDSPAKQFALGFDTHGRLLELALLSFDSGNRLVIHAMRARQKYFKLLG